ncbi:MFS transporter [Cellulomonas fimi]|uniref:MFS transporter n=1 Tax=Cellulomonas fimi TaxID=1708 RepID=A0A7Y0M282_CELFI|nr:MFS transporter [Cellulomonas fimi]NMR21112.1 MFS transporter [Cellulomonas fimi]
MLGPYRDILTRPGALAFSSTGLLARLPISMVGIGIVLMVSVVYDSYAIAGRVSAVYVISNAVCGPQLARFVDRHGQARVMRWAIGLTAIGLAALVLVASAHAPTPWLYVTAVLAGAPAGSFGALVRARWSYVLDDPRALHTAYSLESALDEVVFVVGPVLATVLATSVAPAAGLLVPLVALLTGGYLFLAQRGTEPPVHLAEPLPDADTDADADAAIAASGAADPVPAGARSTDEAREARRPTRGPRSRSVLRHPGMVVLCAVFAGIGAIFGATDVSTVAFAEARGSTATAGLLLAVFALGSLIAGLGYGARHFVMALWKRFAMSVVALAVGVSLFLFVTSTAMLGVVMFVTGFAIAPSLITGNGLVQNFVPPRRLTEGLTWVSTALGLGVSIGASSAGALIDRMGASGGFLVVTSAGVVAVLATLVSLRALRAGSSAPEVEPARP